MDVRGVGAGLTGVDIANALRVLAAPGAADSGGAGSLAPPADAATGMLRELSAADAARFLQIVERPPSSGTAARLDGLLGASVSAAAGGDVQQALVKLAEFAALDPRRAESLAAEPNLESIRPEVSRLLSRLASAAHMDAESRLGQAAQLQEAAGPRVLPGQEFNPAAAILIAGRLIEAGGFANCVRSAELSQLAINQYAFAPVLEPVPPPEDKSTRARSAPARPRRDRVPWLRSLWQRAPLLVLLLGWLAVGLAGGSAAAVLRALRPDDWPESLVKVGFEIWATGFLGLIAFGFYARVRDVRW